MSLFNDYIVWNNITRQPRRGEANGFAEQNDRGIWQKWLFRSRFTLSPTDSQDVSNSSSPLRLKIHMKNTKMTISKVAQQAGVGIEAIRYYQRLGLIQEPSKPSQGYRHYPQLVITQIRFIKRAQNLGFTLKEIRLLLSLGEQQCSETRELAGVKLKLVQNKIQDLQSIEHTLKDLIQHCESRKENEACPIIYSISH